VHPPSGFVARITEILEDIQETLFDRARARREENTHRIDSKDDFYELFKGEGGGFALAHWSGDADVEERVKDDLSVTIRCIPVDDEEGEGTCPFTGKRSSRRVVWAKAY